MVNVAANYAVNQCTNVFGRIDNLFTEQYQNPSGFDRPGIGIFGGIRISNRWRRVARSTSSGVKSKALTLRRNPAQPSVVVDPKAIQRAD